MPLTEFFGSVTSSDIASYGFGEQEDFLKTDTHEKYDWIITNPPFKLAEAFISHGLARARKGVAMLVRTTFIESIGRYDRLFSQTPPTKFAQFVERVPMVKGRLDRTASTATGYCWLVWEKELDPNPPQLVWIPPCRRELEKPDDYKTGQLSLVL